MTRGSRALFEVEDHRGKRRLQSVLRLGRNEGGPEAMVELWVDYKRSRGRFSLRRVCVVDALPPTDELANWFGLWVWFDYGPPFKGDALVLVLKREGEPLLYRDTQEGENPAFVLEHDIPSALAYRRYVDPKSMVVDPFTGASNHRIVKLETETRGSRVQFELDDGTWRSAKGSVHEPIQVEIYWAKTKEETPRLVHVLYIGLFSGAYHILSRTAEDLGYDVNPGSLPLFPEGVWYIVERRPYVEVSSLWVRHEEGVALLSLREHLLSVPKWARALRYVHPEEDLAPNPFGPPVERRILRRGRP